MKNTVTTFLKAKQNKEKLSMLTAYDCTVAKLIDEANINAILVGDSLGNVMLGLEDTLSVTMEDMIHHGRAVARGIKNSMLVIDMPFMSYQVSTELAVMNAGRLVKEGRANAVKLEGGKNICTQISAIVSSGIPVMGHLGLTPQSVNSFGGYKVQGKSEQSARNLVSDALEIEKAGAFAVVLECVPAALAEFITSLLSIPTIGIGAGAGCDGQVLVYRDMLGGFSESAPHFVKKYSDVGNIMKKAFEDFDNDVKSASFPSEEYSYFADEEIIEKIKNEYRK